MDILTAVLEALQLRATDAQRVRVDADHREHIERGHAVMIVVTDGRYTATAGPAEYDLSARDFLLVMADQTVDLKRRAGAGEPLMRCDYALRADLPHPLMRQLPPILHFGARLTDQAEFGRTIALLEAELANARVGVDFVATRLAEIAFAEALRKGVLEKAAGPAFLSALADSHVRASLDAIHRAPNEAWTVVDLAAIAKLSRAAFAERFQRLVGEPPLRYLRTWRLLNARRELARGKATVRIVAEHAGYRSANGFSRAFRRFFSESPSAARRTS
jgi:AraC-like DNA-binding protein